MLGNGAEQLIKNHAMKTSTFLELFLKCCVGDEDPQASFQYVSIIKCAFEAGDSGVSVGIN